MMFRIGEDGDVKVTGRPQSVEEALEFSIDKWEFIRDNASDIITDGGTSTCGLCSMFARLACDGCPVKVYTGHSACQATPYYLATEALFRGSAMAGEYAQKEVDFLKKVREEYFNGN